MERLALTFLLFPSSVSAQVRSGSRSAPLRPTPTAKSPYLAPCPTAKALPTALDFSGQAIETTSAPRNVTLSNTSTNGGLLRVSASRTANSHSHHVVVPLSIPRYVATASLPRSHAPLQSPALLKGDLDSNY